MQNRLGSAKSKIDMEQVEAVSRETLNIDIMMETLVESCPKFLKLALMSGRGHACQMYEARVKKRSDSFFLSPLEIGKTGHSQKLPEQNRGPEQSKNHACIQ